MLKDKKYILRHHIYRKDIYIHPFSCFVIFQFYFVGGHILSLRTPHLARLRTPHLAREHALTTFC